jgi:hypothetical protein
LGKILCLRWANALSSEEAINGSPISATKLFKRLLRRWRFALRLYHHAPVGGGKRRRTLISASRTQRRHVILSGGHIAIELKTPAKIKPASRLRQRKIYPPTQNLNPKQPPTITTSRRWTTRAGPVHILCSCGESLHQSCIMVREVAGRAHLQPRDDEIGTHVGFSATTGCYQSPTFQIRAV